jgi:hypothetical protein
MRQRGAPSGGDVGTPDLGIELSHGPYGDHLCRRAVEVGVPDCEAHRGTALDGFRDDGTPCLSRYLTPSEREASWWANRGEILDRFVEVSPGQRPWAWWIFEAEGPLPDGAPWPDTETSAAWLEARGLLSARERAALRKEAG